MSAAVFKDDMVTEESAKGREPHVIIDVFYWADSLVSLMSEWSMTELNGNVENETGPKSLKLDTGEDFPVAPKKPHWTHLYPLWAESQ